VAEGRPLRRPSLQLPAPSPHQIMDLLCNLSKAPRSPAHYRFRSSGLASICLFTCVSVNAQSSTHQSGRDGRAELCGVTIPNRAPVQLRLDSGEVALAPHSAQYTEGRVSIPVILFAEPAAPGHPFSPLGDPASVLPTSSKQSASSALVSRRDIEVKTSLAEWNGYRFNTLFVDLADRGPTLLAVNVSSTRGEGERTSSFWLPLDAASGSDAMGLNLAALEHLYSLSLAVDAEGTFRFPSDVERVAHKAGVTTQADLLRAIAHARQCVLRQMDSSAAASALQWHVAVVERYGRLIGPGAQKVAVQVKQAGRAVVGAEVAFARQPHFGCFAKSDSRGVAACELQDLHVHADDEHDGEVPTPVVATYRGAVGQGSVYVPMTLVIPPASAGVSPDVKKRHPEHREQGSAGGGKR
jgi:hypothetical protein